MEVDMPLIIFTFSVKTETQEAVFSGNIEPQQALQVLQQIVVAELVKANEQKAKADLETKKDNTPRG